MITNPNPDKIYYHCDAEGSFLLVFKCKVLKYNKREDECKIVLVKENEEIDESDFLFCKRENLFINKSQAMKHALNKAARWNTIRLESIAKDTSEILSNIHHVFSKLKD